jgi:Co/Zn/Cd efflux system component
MSRRLGWALAITATFMAVELVGGLLSGSLALLADAAHMLTDAGALALAWFAARLTMRPANARRSYGYHRAQVLAAFVNALALFAIVGWILFEAVQRLRAAADRGAYDARRGIRRPWQLLGKSTRILMEGTPEGMDPDVLRGSLLAALRGVRDVHDYTAGR